MLKVLIINSVYGFGSTGKIVRSLNNVDEFETMTCYGRKENNTSDDNVIKVSNSLETIVSMFKTIAFNDTLQSNKLATKKISDIIDNFEPDLIHLHNIHGYYVCFIDLFKKLKEYNKPIVWTLHDCWPITGYCCYFDYLNCNKYTSKCTKCEHRFSYPYSIFKQKVEDDFRIKKELILNLKDNLTFVTPSNWLKKKIEKSMVKDIETRVINNGISFKNAKESKKKDKFSILAVANYWTVEKGLNELKKIVKLLDKEVDVTIVGRIRDKKGLEKCTLIERTDDLIELMELYSSHHLFINPTLEDNFPTVNIESLCCGTPIISYNTGGSPEIYDEKTGITIEKYDCEKFAKTINELKNAYTFNSKDAINRSKIFSEENMINNYLKLYKEKIEGNRT